MTLGLLVVVSIYALVVTARAPVVPEDDAFITYKYADNLAAGRGFVFTPSQRVLGTTTPLFALVLAPVRLLVGHAIFPAVAVRLGVVWLLATAWLLVAVLRGLGLPLPFGRLAGCWVILVPQSLEVSLGGMEPFFFHAIALGAFLLALRGHWPAAAAAASLAVMARPEGVVLLAALGLAWLLSGRPRPLATLTASMLPAGLWAVFASGYFGSPIPASVTAKLAARSATSSWDAAGKLAADIGRWLLGGETGAVSAVVSSLVSAALFCFAVFCLRSRRPLVLAAVAWALVHAGCYIAGDPPWYPWYGALLLVPWWLAMVLSLAAVGERIGRRWLAGIVITVLSAAQVVGAVVGMTRPGWPGGAYKIFTPYRLRISTYYQAADFINRRLDGGAQVLCPEIGALGWRLDGASVFDSLGLVSPKALAHVSSMSQQGFAASTISPRLVEDLSPSVVLTFPMSASAIETDAAFARNYLRVGVFTVADRDYPAYTLSMYVSRSLLPLDDSPGEEARKTR